MVGNTPKISRSGTGSPLLLLHGGGGVESWAKVLPRLAAAFEVIVVEHPGFGRSEPVTHVDTVDDLAYFYLDLLERTDLRDVHLLGHSLGGWIAVEMAIRNTSRIQTLTLVAAAGNLVTGVPMGDPFLWSAEETVRQLFVDTNLIDEILAQPLTEEGVELAIRNQQALAKYAWSPRFHNPHLRNWLHRVDVRTLILWGDSDRLFPLEYGQTYCDLIPDATLTTIQDCGHSPMLERPVEFVSRLQDFYAGQKQ